LDTGLFDNDSPVQITDLKGHTILPHRWRSLLEPNMTIVVNTGASLSQGSPTALQSPPTLVNHKPSSKLRAHYGYDDFEPGYDSVAAMMPQESDFEDQSYDIGTVSSAPVGHAGLGPLQNRFKSWDRRDDPFERRASGSTTVSMFVDKRGVSNEGRYVPGGPLVENNSWRHRRKPSEVAEQMPGDTHKSKESSGLHAEWEYLPERDGKPKLSGWSKVNKVLRFFTGNVHVKKEFISAPQHSRKPSIRVSLDYQQQSRLQDSISRRRGVPDLSPVNSIPPPANASSSPSPVEQVSRRSKSLGIFRAVSGLHVHSVSLDVSPPHPPTTGNPTTPEIQQPPEPSHLKSERKKYTPPPPIRSISLTRKPSLLSRRPSKLTRKSSVISPPIPRRPSKDLGVTAQFKSTTLNRETIREMVCANEREKRNDSALALMESGHGLQASVPTQVKSPVADDSLPYIPQRLGPMPPLAPSQPSVVIGTASAVPVRKLSQIEKRPGTTSARYGGTASIQYF